jgi:hypothetical protein
MATPQQVPYEFKLTAGYNTEPEPVPRLRPYDRFRTLGVYLSPIGSTALAKQKLKQISVNYATAITGSGLNRRESLWSYLLYLIPKLTYSVPALTLTEEESKDIQSPLIVAVLPKLHINRNTARTIVFGPTKYGGLAIPTVYSEQSYGQLAYFTGHVNLQDKTGKLLLISLSYLQLLSGSELSILQQPYLHYKWIEQVWLTSFWAFLSKARYKIVVRKEWLPTKARYNDKTLMTHFMALGYSNQQLGQLNRCRLYICKQFFSQILYQLMGKLLFQITTHCCQTPSEMVVGYQIR